MKIYIEPVVFEYKHSKTETSLLPKSVFRKAKEGKLELKTSVLSSLQYIGAVHELLVTRKTSRQTHTDSLFEYAILERELKNSSTFVYPTEDVLDIATSYVLDRDVYREDALHLATAKASKCDMYIMTDPYKDINKSNWKHDFEMIDLQEKEDIDSALDKINRL